ncbi:EpsG family protein [Crenothrix sp.]|uniref:EpsG family protein n=1 Tax=Crenothrix sp. TaxID=3100433 RepID=UPI00374D42B3
MLGYWILIGIPTLLSFAGIRKRKDLNMGLFIVGFVYLIFIGLRYEVGADRVAYAEMYDNIASLSFQNALLYTESGFAALNWVLAQMDAGVYWVNFIVAIIFVSGLIQFAKRTPLPWLALISVTPYLVIAVAMSGVRQSAAIGLVFHLMASWRKGLVIKLFFSLVAILFHYSALMSLIFVQQSVKMPVWFRVSLLSLGAIAMYPILSTTDAYAKYNQTYLEDNIVSSGALMHVLLNAIPAAIYLLLSRKWKAKFGESDFLPMLSVLSIASVFGVGVSSTGIDRLALYLSPIQMIVYGSLPLVFGRQHTTKLSLAIVGLHLIILFWWLNYANTAFAFLPYNNLIIHWLVD